MMIHLMSISNKLTTTTTNATSTAITTLLTTTIDPSVGDVSVADTILKCFILSYTQFFYLMVLLMWFLILLKKSFHCSLSLLC